MKRGGGERKKREEVKERAGEREEVKERGKGSKRHTKRQRRGS